MSNNFTPAISALAIWTWLVVWSNIVWITLKNTELETKDKVLSIVWNEQSNIWIYMLWFEINRDWSIQYENWEKSDFKVDKNTLISETQSNEFFYKLNWKPIIISYVLSDKNNFYIYQTWNNWTLWSYKAIKKWSWNNKILINESDNSNYKNIPNYYFLIWNQITNSLWEVFNIPDWIDTNLDIYLFWSFIKIWNDIYNFKKWIIEKVWEEKTTTLFELVRQYENEKVIITLAVNWKNKIWIPYPNSPLFDIIFSNWDNLTPEKRQEILQKLNEVLESSSKNNIWKKVKLVLNIKNWEIDFSINSI